MGTLLSRSLWTMRHLFLVLLAIGIVTRMGAVCDAMAATPAVQGMQEGHCADMPPKPGKPIKVQITACALCAALPDSASAKIETAPLALMPPVAALTIHMTGLIAGPTPPPPRIA